MIEIEEIKEALNEQSTAKVFPTYLKAIEDLSETSEEIKERLVSIGGMKANFSIPEAGVVAHLETKIEVSMKAGVGRKFREPDVTYTVTENSMRDLILAKSGIMSIVTDGMLSGQVKLEIGRSVSNADMNKAMRVIPIFDELNKLGGTTTENAFSEAAKELLKARESDEGDIKKLWELWFKVTGERSTIDPNWPKIVKKHSKVAEPIKINYRLPSAGLVGYIGIDVKRSLSGGEGTLDDPDITIEFTEEILKEVMTGKISLSSAHNLDYIEVDRKNVGKMLAVDSIFKIANEELGIKD